jgi:hypothetical protein
MPKLGLSADGIAERKRAELTWGLDTGAVRDIVQTYRDARQGGDSEITSFNAAADAARALRRPVGEIGQTMRVLDLGRRSSLAERGQFLGPARPLLFRNWWF